jgi:hypothetical protein
MPLDFDPAAFLEDLRKKRASERPPAKVANPAKVLSAPEAADETLATLAGLADGLPPERNPALAALAGLAGVLPPEQKLKGPAEEADELLVAGEAPPAKVANPAKVSLHLQLVNALARELFDDGGPEKTWLIDTSVRAKSTLLDQMPEGVDPAAWREAVFKLSDSITASGRLVGRAYDDQPLITLKVPIVENQAPEIAPGASNQKSGTET